MAVHTCRASGRVVFIGTASIADVATTKEDGAVDAPARTSSPPSLPTAPVSIRTLSEGAFVAAADNGWFRTAARTAT